MDDLKTLSSMWRYPEAASFLGVSPATLRRKVMLRKVPFMRPFGFKGRILFDPEDLVAFVKASRVDPIGA
jgi:hypothetical protein